MTDISQFPSIGILGFGTIGAGVALMMAASGRAVTVIDTSPARIEAGKSRVERTLDADAVGGSRTDADKRAILQRIVCSTSVADLADVDAVLEAVDEDLRLKTQLLETVSDVVRDQTPLLTNTSALSVTEIAAALPRPGRVAGLQFFPPVAVQSAVEVIAAQQTDDLLVEQLVGFVESLGGKAPIVVKDRPGFLINSMLMPYLNDVIAEYDDGLATAEDIDIALELGLGYRTGPMKMLDMIGLDVALKTTDGLHDTTGDSRYAAPPLLRRMVVAGRLGDKVGHGFRATPSNEEN